MDANQRFQDRDETIAFNLSFCGELEHYLNDNTTTERSLARIKPRDPGLFRVWRYKTALELKRFPIHLDAIPIDSWATPKDLEDAERAVSGHIGSRLSRFDMARRRYVGGKNMAGAWGAELCYSDGEMYVEPMDPRCIRWADGFLEPHAKRNPWVMTISRMPVAEVKRRKGWKVPADLRGDEMRFTEDGYWNVPQLDSGGYPIVGKADSEPLVTVVKYRCRFENYGRGKETPPRELDPAMYHLACPDCGFKSPPQAESPVQYPPIVPGGCPDCGGTIGLVTKTYEDQGSANSKRLVICAPFSGHEEPFYEGPWEFDYPTFPVLYVEAYVMPHRAGGQSDTQVLKTPVLASDAMVRLGYETMLGSKPKWYTQRGAIENARGAVFGFEPEDGDVMYGTGEVPRPPVLLQGQGVNASMFALYDRLQSVFRSNESTSELALSPSEIKDAKVGTIEQVTETGNVVIDDHGDILYDAESLLLTCLACALRELPSKEQRYQDQKGQWQFAQLGGPTMPRVEIRVGSGRLLDSIDADDLRNYQQLSMMPPNMLEGFSRFAHVRPEVIGQIEKDRAAMPSPVAPGGPPMSGVPPGPMGAGGPPQMLPPEMNPGGMQ